MNELTKAYKDFIEGIATAFAIVIITMLDRKIHRLKIDKQYFRSIKNETKTFEIRYNDRDYKVGDYIIFPGNWIYEITYITNYNQKTNYVVMSIKLIKKGEKNGT